MWAWSPESRFILIIIWGNNWWNCMITNCYSHQEPSCNKHPLSHNCIVKVTVLVDFMNFKYINILLKRFSQIFCKCKDHSSFKLFATVNQKIEIAAVSSFTASI